MRVRAEGQATKNVSAHTDNPLNTLCFSSTAIILTLFVAVLVHATYPWSA